MPSLSMRRNQLEYVYIEVIITLKIVLGTSFEAFGKQGREENLTCGQQVSTGVRTHPCTIFHEYRLQHGGWQVCWPPHCDGE